MYSSRNFFSVHSWFHLCIDINFDSGVVTSAVNGKIIGEDFRIPDLRGRAVGLTLGDVVLGENNRTRFGGDQGHRSYIGNLNWFSSLTREELLAISLNLCPIQGDLLR